MANYVCAMRTNYFRVKDEEAFKELMSRVISEDCDVWEKTTDAGEKLFAFGGYSSIDGVHPKGMPEDEDYDEFEVDDFLNELADCVADDDAVLIFEGGHEKLRYITGSVTVVTSKDVKYIDIDSAGRDAAREMLCNPDWQTACCY